MNEEYLNWPDERKIDTLKHLYFADSEKSAYDEFITDFVNKNVQPFTVDEALERALNYEYHGTDPNKEQYKYNYYTDPVGPIIKGYKPLTLYTYYPLVHPYYNAKYDDYPFTGHSELSNTVGGNVDGMNRLHITNVNKSSSDSDYDLLLNNCADATRATLEAVFGKQLNPFLFTTPGDVRDFALENGGISKDKRNRVIIIPMNKERYQRLAKYNLQERRKMNPRYNPEYNFDE